MKQNPYNPETEPASYKWFYENHVVGLNKPAPSPCQEVKSQNRKLSFWVGVAMCFLSALLIILSLELLPCIQS